MAARRGAPADAAEDAMTEQTFDPVESGWTDIGCGVWIRFWEDGSGRNCGLIEAHRNKQGNWCKGAIHFRGEAHNSSPEWDVISMDPLTLAPSLLCRMCGHHGFIQHGRWVPA